MQKLRIWKFAEAEDLFTGKGLGILFQERGHMLACFVKEKEQLGDHSIWTNQYVVYRWFMVTQCMVSLLNLWPFSLHVSSAYLILTASSVVESVKVLLYRIDGLAWIRVFRIRGACLIQLNLARDQCHELV
uniref:Uncharacterized protein n=1 Tax=Oryza brachyantha TaxID=4533 RepID=J3LNL4_ORYBR